MDVEIREPDVGPMQVQGPKSKEVMTDLFGEDILEVPYYYMVHRELDGMELVISRTGYSGELGYELYLKNASRDGLKLWDRVLQAGEPHGRSPIGPCDIRRVARGGRGPAGAPWRAAARVRARPPACPRSGRATSAGSRAASWPWAATCGTTRTPTRSA